MKKDNKKFIFISGAPRTGTTMMIKWLAKASPMNYDCFKETDITKFIHETINILESNQKDHKFGFKVSKHSKNRKLIIHKIKEIAESLYLTLGWDPKNHIIDKRPYMLSDCKYYYKHIIETFPNFKMIYMLRDHIEVIFSMRNRHWGRGPWPRPKIMSHTNFYLENLENLIGDLDINDKESISENKYIHEFKRWSVKKCCIHYKNSINGLFDLLKNNNNLNIFIVDYNKIFNNIENYTNCIRNFLDIDLSSNIDFKSKDKLINFSETDQNIINEIIDTDTINKYNKLKNIAEYQLKKF